MSAPVRKHSFALPKAAANSSVTTAARARGAMAMASAPPVTRVIDPDGRAVPTASRPHHSARTTGNTPGPVTSGTLAQPPIVPRLADPRCH